MNTYPYDDGSTESVGALSGDAQRQWILIDDTAFAPGPLHDDRTSADSEKTSASMSNTAEEDVHPRDTADSSGIASFGVHQKSHNFINTYKAVPTPPQTHNEEQLINGCKPQPSHNEEQPIINGPKPQPIAPPYDSPPVAPPTPPGMQDTIRKWISCFHQHPSKTLPGITDAIKSAQFIQRLAKLSHASTIPEVVMLLLPMLVVAIAVAWKGHQYLRPHPTPFSLNLAILNVSYPNVDNRLVVNIEVTEAATVYGLLMSNDVQDVPLVMPTCPPEILQGTLAHNLTVKYSTATIATVVFESPALLPETEYLVLFIAADKKQRCLNQLRLLETKTLPNITLKAQEVREALQDTLQASKHLARYAHMQAQVMKKSSEVCDSSAKRVVRAYEQMMSHDSSPPAVASDLMELNTRLHKTAAASRTLADETGITTVSIAYDLDGYARLVRSAILQLSSMLGMEANSQSFKEIKRVMAIVAARLTDINEAMAAEGSAFSHSKELHLRTVMIKKEVGAIIDTARLVLEPTLVEMKVKRHREATDFKTRAAKLIAKHKKSWLGNKAAKHEGEELSALAEQAKNAFDVYDQATQDLVDLASNGLKSVQERFAEVEKQHVKSRHAIAAITSLVAQSEDFATPFYAKICLELLQALHVTLKNAAQTITTHV